VNLLFQDLGVFKKMIGITTILDSTQIAANFVTAFSILFLIVQFRLSNEDRCLEAIARSIDSYNNVLSTLSENPQLADVYYRGLRNPRELTASEEVQFSCFIGQLFWSWEMIFHQTRRGREPSDIWQAQVSIIDDVLATPGAMEWWESRKRWYSNTFRNFVNSRLNSGCGQSPHGWSRGESSE
jgi:hypothetical protein